MSIYEKDVRMAQLENHDSSSLDNENSGDLCHLDGLPAHRSHKLSFNQFKQQNLSCPHGSRRHYAKNMCMNCYHRSGRTKKAWACSHNSKLHYSKGLCQNCYLANYYRERKAKNLKALAQREPVTDAMLDEVQETIAQDKVVLTSLNPITQGEVSSSRFEPSEVSVPIKEATDIEKTINDEDQ